MEPDRRAFPERLHERGTTAAPRDAGHRPSEGHRVLPGFEASARAPGQRAAHTDKRPDTQGSQEDGGDEEEHQGDALALVGAR